MRLFPLLCAGLAVSFGAGAQVPGLLHHQGRVLVGSAPFTGNGGFRFALVNGNASSVFWRNAPDANTDGVPDAAVSLAVSRGLYSVLLGDTAIPNMAAVPSAVFANSDVRLRVWFDDGIAGTQLLAPDQRIAPVGYAMMAATVPDGSVVTAKLSFGVQATLASVVAISNQVAGVALPSMPTVSALPADPALVALGYSTFMNIPAPAWVNGAPGSPNAPGPRSGHSGVWSGDAFIIWGGNPAAGVTTDTGAMYSPQTDTWEPLGPFVTRPSARGGHSAVWTGTEMIVWGGAGGGAFLGTGSRFIPSPQGWTTMPVGPVGRDRHVAVWTGARMIVWGGRNADGYLSDGSLFDPASTATPWTTIAVASPPAARERATGIWTGSRLVIWGGIGASGVLGSGARLLFSGDAPQSWQAVSTSGAPSPRYGHSAIWTGSRMIVWGGVGPDGVRLSDGGSYDPTADAWQPIQTEGAPTPRQDHGVLYTGLEMLIVAGAGEAGPTATGAAYDPVKNTWRSLTPSGAPVVRSLPAVVWTGTELEVFGGDAGGSPVGSLQRLVPQPTWYFYRKP